MTSESGALLEIRNLKKHFQVGGGMFGSMTGKKEYLKAVGTYKVDQSHKIKIVNEDSNIGIES